MPDNYKKTPNFAFLMNMMPTKLQFFFGSASLAVLCVFIMCGSANDPLYPEGLIRLAQSYPHFVKRIETNGLVFHDGTFFPWDDGLEKTPDQTLVSPDFQEMMSLEYRGDKTPLIPDMQDEAGRLRYEPFFYKMYGSTEAEVRANLRPIIWMPGVFDKTVKVNGVNGCADSLQIISNELALLGPQYHKYLYPIGGVFKWRTISGSTRISMHALAIAIDINAAYGNYWDWEKDDAGFFTYKNSVPMEIVHIFERHGFIWGGRWRHYDTMHFEFRPELLIKKDQLRTFGEIKQLPQRKPNLLAH